MSLSIEQFKQTAIQAARTADQKQGEDILLLDLSKTENPISDFVLIMTATSEVHVRTLAEEIKDVLKADGLAPWHREGIKEVRWAVIDYGDLMVHVMQKETRDLYLIERLWDNAKKIVWKEKQKAVVQKKAAAQKKVIAQKKVVSKKIVKKKKVVRKKAASK